MTLPVMAQLPRGALWWRALHNEWAKTRRTRVWLPVLLLPLALLALQFLNFSLRYERLTRFRQDPWWLFVNQHATMWAVLLLPLLCAVLVGTFAGVEHQGHQWKQQLALPLPKSALYLVKAACIFALLALSTALVTLGVPLSAALLGKFTLHPLLMPLGALFVPLFVPLLASAPLLGLQLWLGVRYANQGVQYGVAVIGTSVTLFLAQFAFAQWLPWVYPLRAIPTLSPPDKVLGVLLSSMTAGIVVLALGALSFVRRDH